MIIKEEDHLAHYGILRRSGRYPWGSGGTEDIRSRDFLATVAELRRKGMSDTEIARGMALYTKDGKPWTTTEFRNAASLAKNTKRAADVNMALRLREKGNSNVAIGKRMGIPESSVRALLAPGVKEKLAVLHATANHLKDLVANKHFLDVGLGQEYHLGVSRNKLDAAISILKDQGYDIHYFKVPQLGTNKDTTIKALVAPNTPWKSSNIDKVQQVASFSDDGGRSFFGIHEPLSVNSKRIAIRYAKDGGKENDGVIFVRPAVKDVSIGSNRYAQVRVAVDGTHFIKGMAVYKNDLPPGVDLMFNTNKHDTGNKLDALKPLKTTKDGIIDPDNPFGAVVRQITEKDAATGRSRVTSSMNILNEEGTWDTWSKSLSSQFLSKQAPKLAKDQLDMTYERSSNDLKSILQLTNPAVRQILLEKFADGTDASAVHLKAAHLPRQSTHVILPVPSLKETEIYAPNFRPGERVVLVRHPHGGVFEIPELVVNNSHAAAKKIMGGAQDAIGIHPKVAEKLSGADFDGDTVLVIPNNSNKVKTAPSLEGLKNFDARLEYPKYDGMQVMKPRSTQTEMGLISNLITDMTIQKASSSDLARAVRHSMVVIDAEKHALNYKLSEEVNGIKQLREKYQGSKRGGASTLISRAGSELRVPDRVARPASEGGAIDRTTGRRMYKPTGKTYTTVKGKVVVKSHSSTKLAETHDAFSLVSKDGGTPIEKVYAEHSNRMKALANQARLASIHTKTTSPSPSAKTAYAKEVASLDAKLRIALRNAPLERQAQVLGNSWLKSKRLDNPDMEPAEIKKAKFQLLEEARTRTGAGKQKIVITPSEWEAIQASAISHSKLTNILKNADLEQVKKLATPKTALLMTPTKTGRAKAMLDAGYDQQDVADALGVSLTTLKTTLREGR